MKVLWPAAAVLVGLAAALAACGDSEEQIAPAPTTADATPATPTQAATASPAPTTPAPPGTLKYVDPTYGYSFEYPADWFLSSPKDNGGRDTILFSYDPSVSDGGLVTPDRLKAFFWVAEGVNKTLDEWLAEGGRSPGQISPPVVLSESGTALGNKEGLVRLTETDGIKSMSYYVPLPGERIFVVNAVPADSDVWSQFEMVLASITLEP